MSNKNYVLLLNMMKLKNFILSILKIPKISVFIVIFSTAPVIYPGGSYSYERGSIDKEVNPNDLLLKAIKNAAASQLLEFNIKGRTGKVTSDKKTAILDNFRWKNKGLQLMAISADKKLLSLCGDRDLILQDCSFTFLWQKKLNEKFCEIGAVSNDGTNIFLMKDDQSKISWWKLEIIDPGILRFWKEKYGQEVTQIDIDVPKEYKGNVANIAYLDSFNTLCLFDRKQVVYLINLTQYDQKLEEITIVIDDTYGESNA